MLNAAILRRRRWGGGVPFETGDVLLLETGDVLLLETGDAIILEGTK